MMIYLHIVIYGSRVMNRLKDVLNHHIKQYSIECMQPSGGFPKGAVPAGGKREVVLRLLVALVYILTLSTPRQLFYNLG
jgi:hypothetical protein